MSTRRLFRIGFWACIAVSLVALAALCVSFQWTVLRMAQFGDSVTLKAGGIWYIWTSDSHRLGESAKRGLPLSLHWKWFGLSRTIPMQWWGNFYTSLPSGISMFWVPLWPIVLVGAGGAALLWRRRTLRGCCTACGYSLAGLPKGAACPECGRAEAKKSEVDPQLGIAKDQQAV